MRGRSRSFGESEEFSSDCSCLAWSATASQHRRISSSRSSLGRGRRAPALAPRRNFASTICNGRFPLEVACAPATRLLVCGRCLGRSICSWLHAALSAEPRSRIVSEKPGLPHPAPDATQPRLERRGKRGKGRANAQSGPLAALPTHATQCRRLGVLLSIVSICLSSI